RAGAPVPSTTSPPRIRISCFAMPRPPRVPLFYHGLGAALVGTRSAGRRGPECRRAAGTDGAEGSQDVEARRAGRGRDGRRVPRGGHPAAVGDLLLVPTGTVAVRASRSRTASPDDATGAGSGGDPHRLAEEQHRLRDA